MGLGWLNIGGVASCAVGGVFALCTLSRQHHARHLESATVVEDLGDLRKLVSLVPLLVAVTGRVMAERTVKGEITGEEAAIARMAVEQRSQQRAAGSVWVGANESVSDTVREGDWALADRSGVQLPVVGGAQASGDFLETTRDVFVPIQGGVLEQFLGELAGHKAVGARQLEQALRPGTALTAVGELATVVDAPPSSSGVGAGAGVGGGAGFRGALKPGGRLLVLRAPADGAAPLVLSRRSLAQLVQAARGEAATCRTLALVFTAAGAALLLTSATRRLLGWLQRRRYRKRLERYRKQRQQQRAAAGLPPDDAPGEAGANGGSGCSSCVVCLDRAADMVYPSCGHLCTCSQCAAAVRRCPICRSAAPPIRVYAA